MASNKKKYVKGIFRTDLSAKEILHARKCLETLVDVVANGVQRQFAIKIGILPQNFNYWMKGKAVIPPKFVNILVDLSQGKFKSSDFRPDIFRD